MRHARAVVDLKSRHIAALTVGGDLRRGGVRMSANWDHDCSPDEGVQDAPGSRSPSPLRSGWVQEAATQPSDPGQHGRPDVLAHILSREV